MSVHKPDAALRRSSGYEEKMRAEIDSGDIESAHGNADDYLVLVLRSLGYAELCDLYEEVPKWYA